MLPHARTAALHLFDDNGLGASMREALAHHALLNRTLKAKRLGLGYMQRLVAR